MANLTHAELIMPGRVLFSGEAEAVVLRADGGDTAFLANHCDFIASVDICVVRIHGVHGDGPVAGAVASSDAGTRTGGTAEATESGSTRDVIAAVHGGFVKVADNKVTVVAPVAELAGEIDVDRATRALEAAEAQSTAAAEPDRDAGEHPSGDMTEAEAAAARARVRLEAANAISAGPSMT